MSENQKQSPDEDITESTTAQLFSLLWERKAWWLAPMVIVFLMIGALLVTTSGSALSPFIYALF